VKKTEGEKDEEGAQANLMPCAANAPRRRVTRASNFTHSRPSTERGLAGASTLRDCGRRERIERELYAMFKNKQGMLRPAFDEPRPADVPAARLSSVRDSKNARGGDDGLRKPRLPRSQRYDLLAGIVSR